MKKNILNAIKNSRVYDAAIKTPLDTLADLSEKFNNTILLKREDLQPVFSFKIRGAFQKMSSLSNEEAMKGVIASSAGNHAQGVAFSALSLGIKATIVMPVTTPTIKVDSVKKYKAKVILHGDSYDEAFDYATRLAQENNYTFVHPYDDDMVIAGQGTVGKEILEQLDTSPDVIFVPVGGGGLLAGILTWVKEIAPKTKIVGVEPEDAACLALALKVKKRAVLKEIGIFVDGVAVRQIGKKPYALVKDQLDDIITVNIDEICAAIKDIYDATRSIAEPAGALSLAGLKSYVNKKKIKNKQLVAINSGANVNFDRLRHIAERAEIGEHKEALFSVTVPETPGSFLNFCKALNKRSITEFNYRFNDAKTARLFVGVALKNGLKEKQEILQELKQKGFDVLDLTDNELAKLHIRHMVGGKSPQAKNEQLFRVQFPEKPGALLKFLKTLGIRWNISLFHYRNHGAEFGRVLIAIQTPKSEKAELKRTLVKTGYTFADESENPAFSLFL